MENFFDGLIKKGRTVDEGIKRLDKLWERPHIFISQYGDRVDEASKHLEKFLESITDIHDELIDDNQPRLNYVSDVNRFLDECQTIYDDMKQQVNEIQGLLTEFGYEGLPKLNEVKQEIADSSILDPELMENLAISDPYEHLKMEKNGEDVENISPNRIKTEELPKFIATPVIKSVGSVPNGEIINKHLRITTPLRGAPQEPVYSPYYYKN